MGFCHTATSGIELSRETFDFRRVGPNTTILNPNHHQAPAAKTLAQNSDTTSLGFGIYAADQIRLHEYFDIVGGVRWDYFGSDVDDKFLNDKRHQPDKMWSYREGTGLPSDGGAELLLFLRHVFQPFGRVLGSV